MRTLTVITAGLSTPSSTRQVADSISAAVTAAVSSRGESLQVDVIELRDLVNDLGQSLTTGISSPALDEVKTKVSASDGLVVVSPVFKASYSGLFKTFFDVLDQDSLNGMPVIIAATAGSARHQLVLDYALRPLMTYMRAFVVPTGVFVATDDFGSDDGKGLDSRISRAAGELADQIVNTASVGGLGGVTARRTGVSPDENVPSFASLLKGHDGV
ncbi:FMN reductase [Corynebacterium testudinoris]|uniref:LLM-partnered FMN reductase, CE1759 family n=1 Tax=Corynebacterium testudinoris TaxID=136857 RepID=A0A0G3H6A7_9CORY|nr:FMN reductase [Corynebacterium testudinoris]AKK08909.1 LLM-partnered FMN reductase, CE1759 family [Corynebacterium testudinoris]MBX8994964.1 FMN reductase [Corynebacterium testudinoris]